MSRKNERPAVFVFFSLFTQTESSGSMHFWHRTCFAWHRAFLHGIVFVLCLFQRLCVVSFLFHCCVASISSMYKNSLVFPATIAESSVLLRTSGGLWRNKIDLCTITVPDFPRQMAALVLALRRCCLSLLLINTGRQ